MDIFDFQEEYGVLICKPCAFAVAPSHLRSHIATRHLEDARHACRIEPALANATRPADALAAHLQTTFNILDPQTVKIKRPPPEAAPIPGLRVYRGFQCSRCDFVRAATKWGEEAMQKHFNIHRVIPRKPGAPKKKIPKTPREDDGPMFQKVYCQRFFASRHQSSYFTVSVSAESKERKRSAPVEKADVVQGLLDEELERSGYEQRRFARVYDDQPNSQTNVSPWLEMTRWPQYFSGIDPSSAVPLAYAANPVTEPHLHILTDSLDRIVEQAHRSICEDRISVFDQARINSFVVSQSAKEERMIMIKLQKGTFRAYKDLWKRLVCFAYRTSKPDQPTPLPHRFTAAQLLHLDRAISLADELAALRTQRATGEDGTTMRGEETAIVTKLDRACLNLCISLLDHTLKGSHFESVVLSFLAVLGVDEKPGCVFRGPLSYSPDLSKFIKIAQMLVVQRAVLAAEEGAVEYPSDMLDEMRERFMVRGSRTAFDWACRLRAYAKKVVSNTTSLGYIIWSEDGETVTYKDASFSMDALRDFVAAQLRQAQQELQDLLLLHPEESREEVVPTFHLHRLRDDHSNGQVGWNFLQDPRNKAQLQAGSDRWLLDRVSRNDWLRDEMLFVTPEEQIRWRRKAVQAYFTKVDLFLERLLLLIHFTSGQPARGTELMSLQHSNTTQGHHRGIFIEEGLVGTVTSYHKGYNITGSTKIIHRYLPREVSELLVYYLWLVLPFWQKLDVLANKRRDPPSAYLWPRGVGSWDAGRLSKVIIRETEVYFNTRLNITMYRHMAIAISRQHLKCGGFKRDYGIDKELADEQASHGSWIAGTVYARGLQEAPGHIEARRREYRAVSREWHSFLGFRVYLGARKRPLKEKTDQGNAALKRVRVEF